ncbi:hypothetical protein QR680_011178 [Steinernema hermaphroditum]|uniref:Peptidase C1A papain C-terminal domain-containing protein n=1 Tax=Steinernema hermaphroditum TaxID=289476 RepID=A0AA39IRD1_9BILA|nr:hypothetical protein QR680_011178 [Steinernema hermaphroditum]
MRKSLLLLLIWSILIVAGQDESVLRDMKDGWREWVDFKTKYKKVYPSHQEEERRMYNYFNNKKFIVNHNDRYRDGQTSFFLKINSRADYYDSELMQMNGLKPSLQKYTGSPYSPRGSVIPQSLDWRLVNGVVSRVKDQGRCASDWLFSAAEALESQHNIHFLDQLTLPKREVMDGSRNYGNQGCNGGVMDNTFKYMQDNSGGRVLSGTQVYGFVDLPSGSENGLKEAVATRGPISAGIDASQKTFWFYGGGVYKDSKCSSQRSQLNHAVLVTGYGKGNDLRDYWIVKNSWGQDWGEKGYMRLVRNHYDYRYKNNCGIASMASYAAVAVARTDVNTTNACAQYNSHTAEGSGKCLKCSLGRDVRSCVQCYFTRQYELYLWCQKEGPTPGPGPYTPSHGPSAVLVLLAIAGLILVILVMMFLLTKCAENSSAPAENRVSGSLNEGLENPNFDNENVI